MDTLNKIENSEGIVVQGPRTQFIVENIKCGGCAQTITKELKKIGFSNVTVDPEKAVVEVDTPQDVGALATAVKQLKNLGYPIIKSEEGLTAALIKAKSYMSCALGKISS